jgi:TetR/AcrR family transcriptional repressor of mexJK operon
MRATKPARVRLHPRRPLGRPKAEDVEALEARLVSVALQAFLLNGYGATSINSIAKSARVSKNTLYARFPSKAALFRVIVARQVADVQEELRPASSEPGESLAAMLRAYVDVALRRSFSREVLEINRLIVSESYQFPELGEAAWGRFQSGVRRIAGFIEVWAERDKVSCRNAAAAAEVFLYSVYGWYTTLMISNRSVTAKERMAWIDSAVALFLASRRSW